MKDANRIAKIIIKGFRRHYSLFQLLTAKAKDFFEHAEWQALRQSSSDRITYYDRRVTETISTLKMHYPQLKPDEVLWHEVKLRYASYIKFHPQLELAETFYNSVFCNIFHRRYYHNKNIFVETTLDSNNLPVPIASVYQSYFPAQHGLKKTIKHIIHAFEFTIPYENLDRDILFIIKSFKAQSKHSEYLLHQIRFDILKPLFIRNKAAYLVGRVVTPLGQQPFIVPLLNRESSNAHQPHALYADALITDSQQMSIIFGFYHAYFFVETMVPSALIHFLTELMPQKSPSDLYAAIGLHKQGKTEFYRALLKHLKKTKDKFIIAPGVPGMVMSVFTLPHYPYVFKVIRDKFAPSKAFSTETVKLRYLLVKKHDRVGRMADTLEYSDVALPRNRISDELLEELRKKVASSLREEHNILIIKHLYIERRMTPMNIYLKNADDEEKKTIMNDWGIAIKDMIAANIFPGDMLLKNFGITPFKRVVFYDYDEVEYLLDVNFRVIPKAQTYEQEMAAEPWYSVGPHDVFPEEFATFITPDPKLKAYFLELHGDLLDANYWQECQQQIKQGITQDVYPYPQHLRFCHLYSPKGKPTL